MKEMNNKSPEDTQKTQFHGGFMYLERIHEILKQLNSVSIVSHNESLNARLLRERAKVDLLDCLFKELYPKMNKTERKECLMLLQQCNREINCLRKGVRFDKSTGTGRLFINPDVLKASKYAHFTMDLELRLRDIVEARGLLMPTKTDVWGSLDE